MLRPPQKMFLWITDPWDTLDHPQDTSLRLIQESLARGYDSYWCDLQSIRWSNDRVLVQACGVRSAGRRRRSGEFEFQPQEILEPCEFRSIQYRPDPPVDVAYTHPLQLLCLGLETRPTDNRRPEIVNKPAALLGFSEKAEGLLFREYAPPTVVSSQREHLEEFGRAEQLTVLKPLHKAQGQDVELLDWTTAAGINSALERLAYATGEYRRPALLQRFLPGVRNGELRLWFLDGALLGQCRRFPKPGDFRVDCDGGAAPQPATLCGSEQQAASAIGDRLRLTGIRLAAVDLIDTAITDYNFTSPGLLPALELVMEKNLAGPVIEALAGGAAA